MAFRILILCAVTLACVLAEKTSTEENDYDIVKSTEKLKVLNHKLEDILKRANVKVLEYLRTRNETAAREADNILNEYVKFRDDFINTVRKIKDRIKYHNLTEQKQILQNDPFLNTEKWEKALNRTKDELHKLEKVEKLYKQFRNMYRIYENTYRLDMEFDEEGKLQHLKDTINLTRQFNEKMKEFIKEVSRVKEFTVTHNLTNVVTNAWVEQLLNEEHWKSVLKNSTKTLIALEHEYHKLQNFW